MFADRDFVLFAIAVSVFLVALIGVAIARLSHRRGPNRWGTWLALACLVLVGAISINLMEACGRYWMVFTTAVPLMAVGFTIDLRGHSQPSAY
jgi:uncharacterized membrane protein YoaK (UPF0700 family)